MIWSSAPQLAPAIVAGRSASVTGGPPAIDTFRRVDPPGAVVNKADPLTLGGEEGGNAALRAAQGRAGELVDQPQVELRLAARRARLIDDLRAIGGNCTRSGHDGAEVERGAVGWRNDEPHHVCRDDVGPCKAPDGEPGDEDGHQRNAKRRRGPLSESQRSCRN